MPKRNYDGVENESNRVDMLVKAALVYKERKNRRDAQDHLPTFCSPANINSATYTLQVMFEYDHFSDDNNGEDECKGLIMAVVGYKCRCNLWGWQRERGCQCQHGCPLMGKFSSHE